MAPQRATFPKATAWELMPQRLCGPFEGLDVPRSTAVRWL